MSPRLIFFQDITYQTAEVEGTPFSLAISYTDYPLQYRVADNSTISLSQIRRRLEAWRQNNGILTKLHTFSCNESQVIHKLLRGIDSEDLNSDYEFEGSSYCNTKIFSILTDLLISDQFNSSFLPSPDNLKIRGRYVITYNGFVFFDNKQWNSTDKSDLKSLLPFVKVMKNLTGVKYYVGLPAKRCRNVETLNITQRIEVEGKLVAAAGFEIEFGSFKKNVFQSSKSDVESEISLVDENGYMISQSPFQPSSKFLGEEHPYLLEKLVEKGVYTNHTHTECIKECPTMSILQALILSPVSSASLPLSILSTLTNTLRNLFLFLHILWQVLLLTLAKPQKEYNPTMLPRSDTIRSVECCHEYNHYERNFSFPLPVLLVIQANCPCGTSYHISPIPDTNLLTLKRGTIPYCGCNKQSISLSEGRETKVERMCYNSTYQHRFRPSKTCILDQDNLTAPGCINLGARTCSVTLSKYFTLLAILFLLMF